MGTLKLSSIIPKKLPVAPMLNDIGLEMSTHASALSEAPAVALRSASRAASRLTKTSTVLENALIPRVSYNEVHLETLLVLTSQGPYRRDKVSLQDCICGDTWVNAKLNGFKLRS